MAHYVATKHSSVFVNMDKNTPIFLKFSFFVGYRLFNSSLSAAAILIYWEGVSPTSLLNALIKAVRDLNPTLLAIPSMVRLA